MKRVSKILALVVVLCMVLSMGVLAAAADEEEEYPMFEEYKAYLLDTLLEDEFWQNNEETLTADLEAAQSPDEESIQNFIGVGDVDQAPEGVEFPMSYEEWYAENGGASGEASGEASDEAMSVEDAYLEYIYEFLLNELEVNSTMTMEQIEDEYMPLFEAGDYETTPADILFNGMLETGVAMTFEEFAEQYTPAAAGGEGDTSEEAYHDYLKEYVAAVPAVSEDHYEEFAALIDASDYETMPADMLFTDLYWGFSAMTYDEFVEAGGAYEIPDFDPDLTEDEEPE